ncbi:hypothetical protein Scep_024394 [Stephania cephalantha]|uniref:Uncharacterized protein n=1 Tax=Stephania cephalantha TaxID=152367 RepID=A0AAP0HYE8_9MAGN
MTRMVQLNIGPKRLVRLTISVLITLIHPSHYLVELNKSHGILHYIGSCVLSYWKTRED